MRQVTCFHAWNWPKTGRLEGECGPGLLSPVRHVSDKPVSQEPVDKLPAAAEVTIFEASGKGYRHELGEVVNTQHAEEAGILALNRPERPQDLAGKSLTFDARLRARSQ